MADLLHNPPAELVRPDYNIYRYTEQIYKIVRFRSTAPLGIKSDKEKHQSYDKKLDASLSRSRRVVLELALCNDWAYFCTFTLGGSRYDLKTWAKDFTQLIRDLRKKYGLKIDYVLVPERHQDGAWHMHGLFSDISPLLINFSAQLENGLDVPFSLAEKGYLDWFDYSQKFGYCSFAPIKNKVAVAFYVTKYITKTMQDDCMAVGLHLYYCTHGLNRAEFHGDVYGNCSYLNKFLQNHYDFCDTGMTRLKDGCDWSFGFEYMNYSDLMESFECSDDNEEAAEVDSYWEATQLFLDGF